MKIGQTSLVVFLSKILGAAIGFVGTVYFARVLGAEVLGLYAMVVALVSWLVLFGKIGFTSAITKRLSEGDDQGAYMIAGVLAIATVATVLAIGVLLGRPYVEAYTSGVEAYVAVSVVWFVIAIAVAKLLFSVVRAFLQGQHLVHIAGGLEPAKSGAKTIIQVGLVAAGYGLLGMFVGYVVGVIVVALFGLVFVSFRPQRPTRKHVRSLFDYAKFSWLGGLKSRAFNDVDIVILGALVPASLVGIYAVAWSLSTFLNLFGSAISKSMFPEISERSATESLDAVSGYVEDSLAFAGLVAIPGLVGGTLLADRLLRIYGPEFTQGTEVLWLLLVAVVCYNFFKQLLNALNAVDRPDLAFRANAVFIVSNVALNVVLIVQFGWVGAAIASIVSVGIGLAVSYVMVTSLLPFTPPLAEISKQVAAALAMGFVVVSAEFAIETLTAFDHNFAIVSVLVALGAATYGLVLLAISARFRTTIARNLPIEHPLISRVLGPSR
ncbi:oligosaccharide flippase family protein [Halovivax gelatinilyticus]|uniref:oligosaccharide flippase family protein n=1 Tax=Halovivax gelatinilyticus TaxID=2961597 RepID=UPI0020CA70D5|nr:oligosaccharide flippase family protein [Halovivax gelatinilyticus]